MKKCVVCYDDYTSTPRDVDGACFSCDLHISLLLNDRGIIIDGYEGDGPITATWTEPNPGQDPYPKVTDLELESIAAEFNKRRAEHSKRVFLALAEKMASENDPLRLTEYLSKFKPVTSS